MKAMYLLEPRKIVEKEIKVPAPKQGEVLVKIKAVGICGSDVHYYETGRIGDFVVKKPLILGHESAGEIVEIGKDVKDLKIGDRVALEPGVPCRKCKFCKLGRYNLCPNMKFMATPPIDGAFTEYITHPADFCFKLPSSISYEEGAMFEPLSVGLWAAEKADLRPEDKVAILGAGTIGIMTLQSVLVSGVTDVTVFDLIHFRLNVAQRLGAKLIVDSKKENAFKEYKDRFDIVFETAGSEITTHNTVNLVNRGGKIVLVGMPPQDEVALNINRMISKEIKISTVFRYANMYPRALSLVSEGKIKLKSLISKHFKLSELQRAFKYVVDNRSETLKIIIEI